VVINCVAERRPDVVDKSPDRAAELNVGVVGTLAAVAKDLGFWLVHISTDYVFDGTRPPYQPDDPPNPLNEYGRTKLAAEVLLRVRVMATGSSVRVRF
jgi:S-adenosylmethionine synthetase